MIQGSVDSITFPNSVCPQIGDKARQGHRLGEEPHCSALLLAGNDLGLGSALDLLALALKLLGHLSGGPLGKLEGFVLLKYIV